MNERKLISKIELLISETQKRWFSIADCGRVRGFDRAYFYNYRHLLPKFGVYDDLHSHRWHKTTFEDWEKMPLHELQIKWDILSEEKKSETQGYWKLKKLDKKLGLTA